MRNNKASANEDANKNKEEVKIFIGKHFLLE